MATAKFGVVGMGVMGRSLALNIEEHGFPVAVWNLEKEGTDKVLHDNPGKKITGCYTLPELAAALEKPRRVLIMIKAGPPVDEMLVKLRQVLEPGDIVIDGGNSWYKDTERRQAEMKPSGINFFGAGVSGGEEGARHGPCIMPGGPLEAWEPVRPIFEAIAAKTDSGACVTHVGPDGSGHFVKMVHNGIEYGDMQLIAEAYDLLRKVGGLSAPELAKQFTAWNTGRLESFLIEITAKIFTVEDPETHRPLVDMVLDAAQQKGTGKWTAQVALDLGIPVPTIAAAIDARVLSSMKKERVEAAKLLTGPVPKADGDVKAIVSAVGDALYASKICSYAQGMNLIRAASDSFGWKVSLGEMARIWKGGCIIRARFLDSIRTAYQRKPDLANLLLDPDFNKTVAEAQAGWRRAVGLAIEHGVAVPALAASLTYYDSYRTAELPQNLTQAQRDAFGAHTYERSDRPGVALHTEWLK